MHAQFVDLLGAKRVFQVRVETDVLHGGGGGTVQADPVFSETHGGIEGGRFKKNIVRCDFRVIQKQVVDSPSTVYFQYPILITERFHAGGNVRETEFQLIFIV